MNDQNIPEPRKMGVWTDGTHIEAKEFLIPNKSPDPSDDIPTIPDLDDLQDVLEKEISMPPISSQKDVETVNALTEVTIGGSADGIEAALEILKSYIPEVEPDTEDTVWTIESLIAELADDNEAA